MDSADFTKKSLSLESSKYEVSWGVGCGKGRRISMRKTGLLKKMGSGFEGSLNGFPNGFHLGFSCFAAESDGI